FRSEVEVSLKLSHENIVRVHDVQHDARGLRFYSMELLEGKSLRALLHERKARGAPTSFDEACEVMTQLLEALRTAHRQTIHRDLKPENMFVVAGEGLRIKVLDFGIAKVQAGSGGAAAMTVGGLALATTYYFAVKTADGLPNWSAVSNGPSGTTILDTPPTVTVGPSASEGQFLTDGTTAISIGGVTNQNSVVFKVTVNDADGDQVLLEIEVQPVGTPFTDTALATSALAPDGSVITLSVPVGSDNLYHWQARAVDDIGTPGTWASFGGNSELVADFTRDATPPDSAVTTSGALRAATYPGMIQGTATDGAGSVASVAVTVQRSSDTLYWTGAGWGALTWLTATGTTTWAYTFTPADGETYAIQSSATDSAGNPETAFGGSSFTYDTTEPNSTVTTSGMQSSGTYGGAIAGTASDGASGIASVQLSVQRSSDGLYWDGGAWGAAQAWLAAAGTTNWTYGFAPANGATYTVQSRATDGAGNQETTPGSSTFSYNISGPDSAILTSGLYGVAGWTGTISGSATTTGGASVATVEITIQRVSDGLYWTGAAWGAITWLAAGGTTSWSYAFTPADGESYQVQSAATDSFANTETSFGSGSFSYDGATPTSTITTSGTYTAGTWSMMIQGTAADTFSGIGGVDVRVQRTSDGLYWNGLAWTAAPAWLFATGTTSWVLPFTPTELAWYQVESRARDGAGNVQSAPSTSTFMVESLGGSGGTKRKSCSLGARGSGSSWWILALCVFIGSLVRSRHAERTNS
ncbi:MAG: Ig-like domain repeat protein, partial [Planctomycetes bacterium]|nr:Ig-like domain repeat protein [Planctomycetota bacterium]